MFLWHHFQYDDTPVGYVDRNGLLENRQLIPTMEAPIAPLLKPIEFLPYKNEADARKTLDAEQIQSYFVIPADFIETRTSSMLLPKKLQIPV